MIWRRPQLSSRRSEICSKLQGGNIKKGCGTKGGVTQEVPLRATRGVKTCMVTKWETGRANGIRLPIFGAASPSHLISPCSISRPEQGPEKLAHATDSPLRSATFSLFLFHPTNKEIQRKQHLLKCSMLAMFTEHPYLGCCVKHFCRICTMT